MRLQADVGWARTILTLRTLLLAALLGVGLAGCATTPPTLAERTYAGRFSAVTTLGERRDSVSGRFRLEIHGASQILDLATPLGTTVARIASGPDGARATGPTMQEVHGRDAEALTEQLLGWRLPVSGLADWIEGRPAPGRAARVEPDQGRPVLIEQDGWTIRVAETFDQTVRPRLLVLERPATPLAPGVVLRLVLDPAAD